MIIRRAKESDLEGLNRLLLQVCMVHHAGRPDLFRAGGKKYTDEELISIIHDESTPIFVAVDEKHTMLGYAFCIIERYVGHNIFIDRTSLYIDDLCVDETMRGQHIGQSLYETVLAFARAQGCYHVTLNVWSCNEPAMRFYEAMGMKPQKTYMETIL